MFEAGAERYVVKDGPPETLLNALRGRPRRLRGLTGHRTLGHRATCRPSSEPAAPPAGGLSCRPPTPRPGRPPHRFARAMPATAGESAGERGEARAEDREEGRAGAAQYRFRLFVAGRGPLSARGSGTTSPGTSPAPWGTGPRSKSSTSPRTPASPGGRASSPPPRSCGSPRPPRSGWWGDLADFDRVRSLVLLEGGRPRPRPGGRFAGRPLNRPAPVPLFSSFPSRSPAPVVPEPAPEPSRLSDRPGGGGRARGRGRPPEGAAADILGEPAPDAEDVAPPRRPAPASPPASAGWTTC